MLKLVSHAKNVVHLQLELKKPLDQSSSHWETTSMSAREVISLREKLGLDQKTLSDAFGLSSHNTVPRWETGLRKPSETLRRLFCLLNDLPKKEAEEFVKKLGQYKLKKR